jgi:uncharacterized SAM-binding protein YcdF (DUF218 family)
LAGGYRQKPLPRFRRLKIAVLVAGALLTLAYEFHNAFLGAIGGYLVRDEAPEKADVALVLGGDYTGRRILTAAELVRQGYVPQVLVSGPDGAYGVHECDLAIRYAVNAGYPESYFRHMEHNGHSTRDEARTAAPILRGMHARTVLLVTSDYHTRRAGGLFRAVTPEISYIVVGAPDQYFSARGWWRNREGQKVAFFEWSKTVASWFGM